MSSSAIIKIFPERSEDFDPHSALESVRSALLVPEKISQLMRALETHGAKALVITPEYNKARAADAKKELVFHAFMEKSPIDALNLARLSGAIEDILGAGGVILPFDRENTPDLGRYFSGPGFQRNPFQDVIFEINKRGLRAQRGEHHSGLK
ncbi:MAG: hypothetical protein PHY92_04365 [Alphaproteobacteria bacterium]|nr:hypothetical protein [Alphaproteobacteria bacterium]